MQTIRLTCESYEYIFDNQLFKLGIIPLFYRIFAEHIKTGLCLRYSVIV